MWFLLAFMSAVFFAIQGALSKRAAQDSHADIVAWAAFVFSLPMYCVFFFLNEVPTVQSDFFVWGTLSLCVNLVAVPVLFKALQVGELSVVMPLSTLTPLFALFTEFILFGEVPGARSVGGVALLVFGAYLIHARTIRQGLLAPVRALAKDPGARLMLLASCLWAVSAVSDRGAVLASSPPFYLAIFGTAFSVAFLPWLLLKRRGDFVAFRHHLPILVTIGIAGGAMAAFQMWGISLTLAANVIAVKRLAALFGVLIGGLFFKEEGMYFRLAAASFMVAGAVVLAGQ